jgi:hypothetical protein
MSRRRRPSSRSSRSVRDDTRRATGRPTPCRNNRIASHRSIESITHNTRRYSSIHQQALSRCLHCVALNQQNAIIDIKRAFVSVVDIDTSQRCNQVVENHKVQTRNRFVCVHTDCLVFLLLFLLFLFFFANLRNTNRLTAALENVNIETRRTNFEDALHRVGDRRYGIERVAKQRRHLNLIVCPNTCKFENKELKSSSFAHTSLWSIGATSARAFSSNYERMCANGRLIDKRMINDDDERRRGDERTSVAAKAAPRRERHIALCDASCRFRSISKSRVDVMSKLDEPEGTDRSALADQRRWLIGGSSVRKTKKERSTVNNNHFVTSTLMCFEFYLAIEQSCLYVDS